MIFPENVDRLFGRIYHVDIYCSVSYFRAVKEYTLTYLTRTRYLPLILVMLSLPITL
jgi:hypothetical protein